MPGALFKGYYTIMFLNLSETISDSAECNLQL